MDNEVRRTGRRLVFKAHLFDYYKDKMEFPNGNTEEWDFIKHNGAAGGLAPLSDGRILMVRQYRNALERYTLEIPCGGRLTPEEPTKLTAMREVEEETGYKPADASLLLSIKTTVAFSNEAIDIYLMKGLEKVNQHLDPNEYVDVEAYTLDELKTKIFSGEIQDSKTICAILAYDEYLRKNKTNI